jgi:hypothetical protein
LSERAASVPVRYWAGLIEVASQHGQMSLRADLFAFAAEVPPATASIVTKSQYEWHWPQPAGRGQCHGGWRGERYLASLTSIFLVSSFFSTLRPTAMVRMPWS